MGTYYLATRLSPPRGVAGLRNYADKMISDPGRRPNICFSFTFQQFLRGILFAVFGFFLSTSLHSRQILLAGDIESNPGPTRILQLNCRSLRVPGRSSEIARIAQENNADVLLLSETWLRPTDSTPNVSGYTVAHRVDRNDGSKVGGGVITYTKPELPIVIRSSGQYSKAETSTIAIRPRITKAPWPCRLIV